MDSPNKHVLEGKWRQIRGEVKEQWGKLSDNQLDRINGQYDQLVGVLQETYGYTTEKAREEVDRFVSRIDHDRP
jgi:uncharacterized protein YjbJ (UPF0337 family)